MVYQFKLHTERKIENQLEGFSREYELFWFGLRSKYDRIALEGKCLNCKREIRQGVHYSEYIRIVTSSAIGTHCPHCKTKESVTFSNF